MAKANEISARPDTRLSYLAREREDEIGDEARSQRIRSGGGTKARRLGHHGLKLVPRPTLLRTGQTGANAVSALAVDPGNVVRRNVIAAAEKWAARRRRGSILMPLQGEI